MMMVENIQILSALSVLSAPLAANPQITAPQESVRLISPKASLRRLAAETALAPVILPRGQYVGELQESWTFPSDHLPIGMSTEGLHFASWNVMNKAFMSWVEMNSQGLKRSALTKENISIGENGLTVRDRHNVDLILEMLFQPGNQQSVISLQECSMAFLEELEERLPPQFKVIRENEGSQKDQNALIYDRSVLDLLNKKSVVGVFSQDSRPFQDILFDRIDGKGQIRILNAHIPGDPNGPARYEFAEYLAKTENKTVLTIAMGDMNFNELEMQDALHKAYRGKRPSYDLLTPYCTNINPNDFVSKAIDHFIINRPAQFSTISQPDELLPGLQKVVDLLEDKKFIEAQ